MVGETLNVPPSANSSHPLGWATQPTHSTDHPPEDWVVTCPLCGRPEHRLRLRQLYEGAVCRRCWRNFGSRRQLAYFVDVLFSFFVSFLLFLILLVFSETARSSVPSASQQGLDQLLKDLLLLLWAGFVLVKDGFKGYSPGKWLVGVRVLSERTERGASFLDSFKRNLPLLVPLMPLVVYFQLLKGYRVGDGWARTKVIWDRFEAHWLFQARPDRSP